ncbi:hypothetical protein NC652_004573 [Populus alba x Populus x berolinensis]|uniref:Uncharacterized protein n=1 Tax=Populus alba x Populus x berolinensis TaxID=444605 RepID=A0AAD6RUF6_9ROSI|nr:hypothetical protein NC652_004573 [Populus alba x Populus x berolinensis]KAJ7015254.1 hypothetical protein NC653_004533 [Populus alba x Populus x berolinensis]
MEKGSFSMTFLFVLFVITTCVSMSSIPVVEGGEIKLNVPCNTTANCHQKTSCPGRRMVLRCVHNFCQCNW